MIKRLRPLPTAEELGRMYARPHDHRNYGLDHEYRVQHTADLARKYFWRVGAEAPIKIADLSAGNGAIASRIARDGDVLHLGDMAGQVPYPAEKHYVGPIEQTIEEIPSVDLFICSETLEHLDRPLETLTAIRNKTRFLLLTTPIYEWKDYNPEHLWAWDVTGVGGLLTATGFMERDWTKFNGKPIHPASYIFGMWFCA